jgi:putative transposase
VAVISQEDVMRGPQPPAIALTDEDRQGLEALVRRHPSPQQVALRARIVRAAADGLDNARIARRLEAAVGTARRWRDRWRGLQPIALADLSVEERLADAPRRGAPARITAQQVCQIVGRACEAPSQSGRPISPWTDREVADEIGQRGIVAPISPRHAGRRLKRGLSSRTASATG